jgi:hypothetical protein
MVRVNTSCSDERPAGRPRPLSSHEGAWAYTCPTCETRVRWQGAIADRPPCPKCSIAPQGKRNAETERELSESAARALQLCDDLESLIEDLPERAEDFAASLNEKMHSICQWVEANEHATESQITALENMIAGAERWLNR